MYCIVHLRADIRLTLWGSIPPIPLIEWSVITTKKGSTITFRLTQADKDKISHIANRCGLSKSEYLKQRALGYEPKAVPPDALFTLLEEIGELQDKSTSPETDEQICKVLRDVSNELLFPGKEDMRKWQSRDSGP